MPEVAGNAAIYFDPYDAASMLSAVSNVLHNNTLKQTLRTEGAKQLQLFSFDNCIANTIKVYQSL
jgi:glycosyltransferase involved in cell wall biosynthesis